MFGGVHTKSYKKITKSYKMVTKMLDIVIFRRYNWKQLREWLEGRL